MRMEEELIQNWYADLYDKEETQTDDIEFMLEVIGPERRSILEVCCGSGRILIPLAKAGHQVTGFDMDEAMLGKIEDKAKELHNIRWYKNDAMTDDWGTDYDAVILAGNIMINIVSELDYKEAQELLIQKAYDCLLPEGYLYLDFNLTSHPEKVFDDAKERVIFSGEDSKGNCGTLKIVKGSYDSITQMCLTDYELSITTVNGHVITRNFSKIKHIPTLENVKKWLFDTGFIGERIYGNYQGEEINDSTFRAIVWAKKER